MIPIASGVERRRSAEGGGSFIVFHSRRLPLFLLTAFATNERTDDVKAIRTKLRMTQRAFAARFGFSINTLRHWDQGKREPEGPTRAYLLVIDRAPAAIQRALRIA
jgi:DNA-binding transcriptional regulator YiaG